MQRSTKGDAGGGVARRWRSQKSRHHDWRRGVERPRSMSPADVAAILPTQHTIDCDIVQAAAEERDLLQEILHQVGEQAPEIVTFAADRSGASRIEWCLPRRHGQRKYRSQPCFHG